MQFPNANKLLLILDPSNNPFAKYKQIIPNFL